NFVDSAWYFLRYPSTDVDDRAWDPGRTARWLPVDLYAGGPEHVTRHHLYARFMTHALHDLGLVPFEEPFPRLRVHGTVLERGAKMSKSRGNVVNPDDHVERVGADNLRMYLLFCGDWQEGGEFSDAGLRGIVRFTGRLWRLLTSVQRPGPGAVDLSPLDRAVAHIQREVERLKFNTAIAALMELARWAGRERPRMSAEEWSRTSRTITLLLAPLAPHMAEEAWARLGGAYSVHLQPWPEHDPRLLVKEQVTLVVQINGRVRARLEVPAGLSGSEAEARALAAVPVARMLGGRRPGPGWLYACPTVCSTWWYSARSPLRKQSDPVTLVCAMSADNLTKEQLLGRIEEGWAELDRLQAGLDAEAVGTPSGGEWRLKDHLAHIAAWELSLIALLTGGDRSAAVGVP